MRDLIDLAGVRSRRVELLVTYLRGLEDSLVRCPLLERFGRNIDELFVQLRIVFSQSSTLPKGIAPSTVDNAASNGVGAAPTPIPERLDDVEPRLERAVLVGDPGSGKTEWIKRRARHAATEARQQLERHIHGPLETCLPMYLPLPELASALKEESTLLDLLVATRCLQTSPGVLNDSERLGAAILALLVRGGFAHRDLSPFLWQRLTTPGDARISGPVLLCFDAWDEVQQGRDIAARSLVAFARASNARILFTTRPVFSQSVPSLSNTDLNIIPQMLVIQPFGTHDVDTFVTKAFRDDPDRARGMCDHLKDLPSLAEMAENPLMATLLCIASSAGDNSDLEVLERRVETYRRVLNNGLVGGWKSLGLDAMPDRGVLVEAKLRFLETLAYRVFPEKVFDSACLHDFLWGNTTGYLRSLDPGNPLRHLSHEGVGSPIVDELCRDAILIRQNDGGTNSTYSFLHFSFQEYLTASWLARHANGDDRGFGAIASIVRARTSDRHWHDVILLLCGSLRDPRPLLEELLEHSSRHATDEGAILAARCLSEVESQIRAALSNVVSRVTRAIMTSWGRQDLDDERRDEIGKAFPALALANARYEGVLLVDWLLARIVDEDYHERLKAGTALGWMGRAAAAYPRVIPFLLGAISNPTGQTRYLASVELGRLGKWAAEDQDVAGALLTRLWKDRDYYVRGGAAWALGTLGKRAAQPRVLSALAASAFGDLEAGRQAAVSLAELLRLMPDEEILQQFRDALREGSSFDRLRAIEMFSWMGEAAVKDDEVRKSLLESLTCRDQGVRRAVAKMLGRIGPPAARYPEIVEALGGVVLFEQGFSAARYDAAAGLAQMGTALVQHPTLLPALLEAMRHENWVVRYEARISLLRMGALVASHPTVLPSLVECLHDSRRDVRCWAVELLEQMRHAILGHNRVIGALVTILADANGDSYVREHAALTLAPLANRIPEVHTALEVASNDDDHEVRAAAASALAGV